jgi:hypothetical protein
LRAYQWLEPILGRKRKQAVVEQAVDLSAAKDEEQAQVPALGLGMRFASWVLVGAMVLIGNRIGHGVPVMDALPGVLLIIAAVFVGDLIYVGARAACRVLDLVHRHGHDLPAHALCRQVAALTGKVNFLAMITPMLTFAGLSLAKDIRPSAAWVGASSWFRCWPMPVCSWLRP